MGGRLPSHSLRPRLLALGQGDSLRPDEDGVVRLGPGHVGVRRQLRVRGRATTSSRGRGGGRRAEVEDVRLGHDLRRQVGCKTLVSL